MKEKKSRNQDVELSKYHVKGHLDLSGIEELDREIPLRIAVARGNKMVKSKVVDLKEEKGDSIEFELEFQLPGRCGYLFLAGRGDIPEQNLLGMDSLKKRVTPNQFEDSEKDNNPYVADLGELEIPSKLYHRWLTICREYVVRGRVVCREFGYDPIEQQWQFNDHPVPGATVEAFDVDCWWWWCFKDQLGSVTTDVNGNFEMRFTWCCRYWFPFHVPWRIDQELLERIRELISATPIPIPEPPTDPFEFQEYLGSLSDEIGANSRHFQEATRMLSGTQITRSPISAQSLKDILPAAPDLEDRHVWPWWHRRDCSPDLIFKVTQPCEGEVKVIYEEDTDQARWNIDQTIDVTLEATEEACCVPEQPEPPCGECLAITGVGCVDISNIGLDAGPPDLRGYAYPNNKDRPFGDNVTVRGDFGTDVHDSMDYYSVQYRKEGMPSGTWLDMGPGLLGKITRKYIDPGSFPPPYQSPSEDFGPSTVDGEYVYKTKYKFQRDSGKPATFDWIWTRPDHLFRIITQNLPEGDGLCIFRVVGYRQASDGSLVDDRLMPLCGIEEEDDLMPTTVTVRVDNRNEPHPVSTDDHPCGPGFIHKCTAEPDCDFTSIVKNESADAVGINPCGDITIADEDTITIHFKVTTPAADKDAHLGGYKMTMHYAESGLIRLINPSDVSISLKGDPAPHVGPTYADALTQGTPGSISRPHWHGGSFKVTIPGSAFPVSCAYLLRLVTWKRTTNGCANPRHFHRNICEFSFCVAKPE